jgi:methylthioribose-1-phosphate isomerase
VILGHPQPLSLASYSAVELLPDDCHVEMLDQRKLPHEETYLRLSSAEEVAVAIESMVIRGAPAIGIAAAYGAVLGLGDEGAIARLLRTRPTAVNLAWALERMGRVARRAGPLAVSERRAVLAAEARAIHSEDVAACRAIGRIGAAHIPDGATVLTYCNAGALATGGYGTALGVLRAAREAGKSIRVIACETRPVLQGARLTVWELARDGFDVTLVVDAMAAMLMRRGAVTCVVVGADRIARSGDVANKVGTYGVACLARVHDVPFFVAAPWSTVDLACPDGDAIPIERRSDREVLFFGDAPVAALGPSRGTVHALNLAFDVTPARLVHAIFTERGEIRPPSERALGALAC